MSFLKEDFWNRWIENIQRDNNSDLHKMIINNHFGEGTYDNLSKETKDELQRKL